MTEPTALQRFKSMQRDNSKLLAELKVQRSELMEAQRKAHATIEAMECDLIDIEDAITQLGGSL